MMRAAVIPQVSWWVPALMAVAVALLAAGGATERSVAEAQEAPQRPNIVFVLTDDMRHDELGRVEGFRKMLVNKGVTFSNSFVTNSVCCPSRTTALTGKYSHNHGVVTNQSQGGGYSAFEELGVGDDALPVWLRSEGYKTGLFGKFINGYNSTEAPEGWNVYHRSSSPTQDNELGRRAAEFVEARHKRPMFIALWAKSPHSPLGANERFVGTHAGDPFEVSPSYDEENVSDKPAWIRDLPPLEQTQEELQEHRRVRLEMLEGVAAAISKVLGTLKKHGELGNTYVVFASDNGYLLGEHRLANTKALPYEESVRVPLVVRGPGIPAGETRPHLVANNDWAPTLADLAGIGAKDSWDGRSLRPMLGAEGQNVADWRAAVLSEHPNGGHRPGHSVVRTQRYSYIEWSTGETELYDLSADPYQLENIAGERPEEEAVLKARLEALRTCAGDSCRTAEDAPAP